MSRSRRLDRSRRHRRIAFERLEVRSLLTTIAGIAFHDLDNDGLHEPAAGELAIAGLTMYLDLNANGRFDSPGEPATQTDAAGLYAFAQLAPGVYRVGQAPSIDWVQTSPAQTPPSIRTMNVAANDIIYSPSRGKFFATFADESRLVVIDPVAGTFEPSVEVGSNLGQLALSDDGGTLYVSVLGGAAVRRVDLTSGTVGPLFTLGSHPQFGPYHVDDMAVLPGSPDVVAISRRRPGVSPPHGGVAIFENGVQRPVVTPDHTGPNLITFGDSPATLYGQDTNSSNGAFYRMTIDASGIRVTGTMGNYSARDIEYDNGRIYTSTGTIIDTEQLRLHGSFSRSGGGNVVAANPFQDVGYLVTDNNNGGRRLEAFDRQSFLPLGKLEFPNLRGTLQLVRFGERGLAIRDSDRKVTLIEWDPRPATRLVEISSELTASGINFASRPAHDPGSITGQVFEDLDRNGLQSAGESVISGRVVFLDQNGNGDLDDGERRTQTDATGTYQFTGLPPGSYFVAQVVDADIRQTSPAPQEARVRRLDLTVNDLIFHPPTGKVVASVPSKIGLRGNSITVIDPATGAMQSHFVGSEPSELALSDDGQVLYVALDGAGAVRQFDVANQQAGHQFWLGQERFGSAVFATDLAVMPGNSQVVVAALETKSDLVDERVGIGLYQNGVEQDAFNRQAAVGPVEFSTAGLLFSATGLNRLARIGVTPTDLNFLEQTATPVDYGSQLEYANGRHYTTTGQIYDASTGLRVGGYPASGAVEPDSNQGITYFLSSGVIKAFDQQSGNLIRSVTIPGASSLHSSLIRWGEQGLAFDSFTAAWFVEWDPRNPSAERFHTVHLTSGQVVTAKDFGNIAVNAPPFVAPDQYTTREDTPLIIASPGVLTNDVADEQRVLVATVLTEPTHGVVTLNSNGSFTYTPPTNFFGTDTFTYRVHDGFNPSDPATVTINVSSARPVITSNGGGETASISVSENTAAVTDVDATDPHPPGNLVYSKAGGADSARFSIHPTTGVLTFLGSRNFESPNDVGADNTYEVIVRASDGSLSDTQTITVTVTNVVELPNITSNGGGPNASISVPENTFLVTDVNSPDEVGTTLTYSISGGTDALKFSINDKTGLLTFVAAPNFESPGDVGGNNVYDVIVQVSNGDVSDTQAVAVTVTNSNDLPAPVADAYSTSEEAPLAIDPVRGVLTNDSDEDAGDSKTVVSVAGGGALWDEMGNGDLPHSEPFPVFVLAPGLNEIRGTTGDSLSAPNDLDAFIIQVPAGLQVTSMTYSVARVTGAIRQVNWSVPPLGSFGTIVPHSTSSMFSSSFPLEAGQYTFREVSFLKEAGENPSDLASYSFRFNVSGESAVGRQVTLPSGALLTLQPDGSFQYDPNGQFESLAQGQTATDSFTYTVADSQGSISTATVTIGVHGANDAPQAVNDVAEIEKDGVLGGGAADGMLTNDFEIDEGDTKTVVAINDQADVVGIPFTLPSGALLTVNADGSYRYDPNGQFDYLVGGESATDSFIYTMSDSEGATSSATVTITITGVNNAPSFTKGADKAVTDESPAQAFDGWATNIVAGPADEAGQVLHFVVTNDRNDLFVDQPALDATGKLTFTPKANAAGTAQVKVVLKDDGGTANGGSDASEPEFFNIIITKAHVWHNAAQSLDVTGPGDLPDGKVVAADALEIINFINAFGAQSVPTDGRATGPYCDVNADGSIAPSDALDVINHINTGLNGEGESLAKEVSARASGLTTSHPTAATHDEWADLIALLAFDTAQQNTRRRASVA